MREELSESEKKKLESNIVDMLSEEDIVQFAYLYGSFLKGRFNDIDIGVYLKEGVSEKDIIEFKISKEGGLSRKLGYKVDLRILNGRKIVFLHQVLKNGKLLMCRDEKIRVEFESKVYSEYLDIKYYLDQYNELRRKRILA